VSGAEPERSGPKIHLELSGLWSGERRSQKWALTRSGKTTLFAPLRSNALHRSNRVNAEKITTGSYIPVIVYSDKVQSDSTTINQS